MAGASTSHRGAIIRAAAANTTASGQSSPHDMRIVRTVSRPLRSRSSDTFEWRDCLGEAQPEVKPYGQRTISNSPRIADGTRLVIFAPTCHQSHSALGRAHG